MSFKSDKTNEKSGNGERARARAKVRESERAKREGAREEVVGEREWEEARKRRQTVADRVKL